MQDNSIPATGWASIALLALLALFGASPAEAEAQLSFSYTGRLTETNGKPVDGPVTMRVSFYHDASGSDPVLSVTKGLEQVPLQEGIFQIQLSLDASDYQQVFSSVMQEVYVEITDLTHQPSAPYGRQQITVVPYAAKIPIDGQTLQFNTQGQLTVSPSVAAATVGGKSAAAVAASTAIVEAATTATSAGTLVLRDSGGGITSDSATAASLKLLSSGHVVSLVAPAGLAANTTFTLPPAPDAGKFLTTNASGVLSWAMPTGGAASLTPGSLVFADGSGNFGEDNTHLFWDAAAKRLGIGTTSPEYPLDIVSGTQPQLQIHSDSTTSRVRIQAGGARSFVEFWPDGTPTKAASLGMNAPGFSMTDDLVMGAFSGSSWAETMRVANNGNVGIGTTGPNSKLQIAGPIATAVASKTAAYTLTASDSSVLADATAAAFTVTLPTAASITGRRYTVKKTDSSANAVTLTPFGVETVDGAGSYVLRKQNDAVSLISDGASWFVDTATGTVGGATVVNTTGTGTFATVTAHGSSGDIATNSAGTSLSFSNAGANTIVASNAAGSLGLGVNGAAAALQIKAGNTKTSLNIDGDKVAIGTTATAGSELEVRGAGASSATSAFNVTNSAGVSSLFVRDDGRVGIGTTSPATPLEVAGGALTLPSLGGGTSLEFKNGGYIRAGNDANNHYVVINSGAGGSGDNSLYFNLDNMTMPTAVYGTPISLMADGSAGSSLVVGIGSPTGILLSGSGVAHGGLRWDAASHLVSLQNAGGVDPRAWTFDTVNFAVPGNVGIGTAAPDIIGVGTNYRTLTVLGPATGTAEGGAILELASKEDDQVGTLAGVIDFVATNNTSGKRIGYIASYTEGASANNRGGMIKFGTKADGGGITDAMIIKSDGKVGIGTASPANRLDVSGNAAVSGALLVGASPATTGDVRLPNSGSVKWGGHGYLSAAAGYTLFLTDGSYFTNSMSGSVWEWKSNSNANVRLTMNGMSDGTGAGTGLYLGVGDFNYGRALGYLGASAKTLSLNNLGTEEAFFGANAANPRLALIQRSGQTADMFQIRSSGATTGDLVTVAAGGNVGIGTTSPGARLEIDAPTSTIAGLIVKSTDDGSTKNAIEVRNSGNGLNFSVSSGGNVTGNYFYPGVVQGNTWIGYGGDAGVKAQIVSGSWRYSTASTERLRIDAAGNVGIGTTVPSNTLHVVGSVCVKASGDCAGSTGGTIYVTNAVSIGADLAEHMPIIDTTLAAGDVVAIEAGSSDGVFSKSLTAYQASAVGVISTAPGVSLGSDTKSSRPVALAGRVPVNVTVEGGAIAVGDYLVAASTPGKAMKALDLSRGGVIGIALSAYDGTPVAAKDPGDGVAHEQGHQVLMLVQPGAGDQAALAALRAAILRVEAASKTKDLEIDQLKADNGAMKAVLCDIRPAAELCRH